MRPGGTWNRRAKGRPSASNRAASVVGESAGGESDRRASRARRPPCRRRARCRCYSRGKRGPRRPAGRPPGGSSRSAGTGNKGRTARRPPGPSSQSIPIQRNPSRMRLTASSTCRSWSVSSIRRMNWPPWCRASSQLNRAVRTPPMCKKPVGLGANRVRMHHDGPRYQDRARARRSMQRLRGASNRLSGAPDTVIGRSAQR